MKINKNIYDLPLVILLSECVYIIGDKNAIITQNDTR
jgi:hypothetical protein